MCTFITLIAASRDVDRLNAVLAEQDGRGHRRRAEAVRSASLRPLLAPAEREYWLVPATCDCGTYLGSAVQPGSSRDDELAAAAERYRRRGWSEAKIVRALAGHDAAASRRATRRTPNEDAAHWIHLIRGIADGLSLPGVGLMHHFYRTAPGLEDLSAGRTSGGRIDAATDVLALMPDGVVHDFDCARIPA